MIRLRISKKVIVEVIRNLILEDFRGVILMNSLH